MRARTGSIVHDIGAQLVAVATFGAVLIDLAVAAGPQLNMIPVGGVLFNAILLNYGLPAVLAIILALIARTTRPMNYRAVAAGTAVTLALFYLWLEVKRYYRGPVLWGGAATDAENYTYSAVWLAFGLLLLSAGVALRSLPARVAAAAVILLTVAKVFLFDTSNLTGIWRAVSLIGLGVPLVIIGYLYRSYFVPSARQGRQT